jgi:hypothetical protein
LTFENTHLVAEHDDLDVLVEPTSPPRRHKADNTTEPDVDEGGPSPMMPEVDENGHFSGPIDILVPFTLKAVGSVEVAHVIARPHI